MTNLWKSRPPLQPFKSRPLNPNKIGNKTRTSPPKKLDKIEKMLARSARQPDRVK
jgi:hypothetical protein